MQIFNGMHKATIFHHSVAATCKQKLQTQISQLKLIVSLLLRLSLSPPPFCSLSRSLYGLIYADVCSIILGLHWAPGVNSLLHWVAVRPQCIDSVCRELLMYRGALAWIRHEPFSPHYWQQSQKWEYETWRYWLHAKKLREKKRKKSKWVLGVVLDKGSEN